MQNLEKLEKMAASLELIRDDAYSLEISDYKISSNASFIIDRIELAEEQVKSVINQIKDIKG